MYDRYGNRWQQNVTAGSGPQPVATFNNAKNQLDGYSYDADGNLLSDGIHSYTYDAESRIIAVDGGATATYVYDAEGRRVQKTTASGTVNYVYDIAGEQVAEVNSSGGVNRIEAYAGGKHIATYANGVIYFNHADWLGTERMRTTASGSSCETIVSLAFGDGTATTGSCSDASPMHFTGKQHDDESNLDDFDARYYSSEWGRMMSADPLYFQGTMLLDPQRFNLYAYARGNPLEWTDPTGEKLFLSGDEGWLLDNVVYPMAGGEDLFDKYFHLNAGEVLFNGKINLGNLSGGLLLLGEMVSSANNYVYYAGTSGAAAAALFAGSVGGNGKLTAAGKDRAKAFSCHTGGCGTLVGTNGRRLQLQPVNFGSGDAVFAVIAYNTRTVQTQYKIDLGYFGTGNVPSDVITAESAGLGQVIPPVNLFIHESAENVAFSSQGNFDYDTAHDTAMVREAEIRNDLHLGGGFAGGGVSSTVPK